MKPTASPSPAQDAPAPPDSPSAASGTENYAQFPDTSAYAQAGAMLRRFQTTVYSLDKFPDMLLAGIRHVRAREVWSRASASLGTTRRHRGGAATQGAGGAVRPSGNGEDLARAERRWGEVCGPLRLQALHLRQVEQARTRLTAAYTPAHRLVALLYEGAGLPDDLEQGGPNGERLPGFLWNMASLFERFVSRFLEEHARGVAVHRQRSLEHLYRVVSAGPGKRPPPPRPRPDLIIERNQQVVAVLDTKYKDLGREGLPRDMLYQLSVYSVAHASGEGVSPPPPVIALYPQQDGPRDDITYGFRHGSRGGEGRIILRAIDWSSASRVLREPRRHAELPLIAATWLSEG